MKDSDIADGDAIGVLALDADGKLKQDKVGERSAGKGAAIGGLIGVSGRRSWAPRSWPARQVGALHHEDLGLSDADKARLTVDMNAGQAAVGVMSPADTAPAISDFLAERGGAPRFTSSPTRPSRQQARRTERQCDRQDLTLRVALATRERRSGTRHAELRAVNYAADGSHGALAPDRGEGDAVRHALERVDGHLLDLDEPGQLGAHVCLAPRAGPRAP